MSNKDNTLSTKPRHIGNAIRRIAQACNLEPHLIQDAYPCTSLQAGLLAGNIQGTADYVSTFVFDVSSSNHDPTLVKKACHSLYDRTPILRTRFIEVRGNFLQVVTHTPIQWTECDDLQFYLDSDGQDGFQLGDALARFAWIKEQGGSVYMVWTLHHALYDEWSVNLLFEDLSSLSACRTEAAKVDDRPHFSKFVKALHDVDESASRTFWQLMLANYESCGSICSDRRQDPLETSAQLEYTAPWTSCNPVHQHALVTIAVWSLWNAKLSHSEFVSFGNVVNGRTANVPGIDRICGPTMTTVPYVVQIPYEETVENFVKAIERTRTEILPFEQTGLQEYRRKVGHARFETILSIRSMERSTSKTRNDAELQPLPLGKRVHSHPCCIFVDLLLGQDEILITTSYDRNKIEVNHLKNALEQLVLGIERVSHHPNKILREFVDSWDMPATIRIADHLGGQESAATKDDSHVQVDPNILGQVQELVLKLSRTKDTGKLRPETSLKEMGFDSIRTVVLSQRLSDRFHVSVPVKSTVGHRKTISDIARTVQTLLRGGDNAEKGMSKTSLFEMAQNHSRSFSSMINSSRCTTKPSSIMLTGATGYLGIELLHHCLLSTKATIILPIRCESATDGLQRLQSTARIAGWKQADQDLLNRRVKIWPSDLSAPQLGLDDEKLNEFKKIRSIIHNGARVDFLLDYHELEATNVSSTAFLLSQHIKSVESPSFVYITGGRPCPTQPDANLEATAQKLATANGYAQTKFTSELLVHEAAKLYTSSFSSSSSSSSSPSLPDDHNDSDVQFTIIHPGSIIGNPRTGIANTDDFLWRYVAASVQMQVCVPAVPTKREWINLTTLELVASSTISAVLPSPLQKEQVQAKVDQVLVRSGLPVSRFWQVIIATLSTVNSKTNKMNNDEQKYKLGAVSEYEFLQYLSLDIEQRGAKNPLFSLSQLFSQGSIRGIGGVGLKDDEMPAELEMVCVESAVRDCILYLDRVGFLDASRDFSTRDGGKEGQCKREGVFGRSRF